MKYGIHIFATEDSIQPGELAQEVESRGFISLLFSEHTHIPVSFLNTDSGRDLEDYYWQTYDPFIAATLAAASTTDIKVGTGVSLILQHDPITLAKQVATIDKISNGRFVFGIGSGWIPEEMDNHGVSYRRRYKHIQEHVAAMKNIWTEDEPEFKGEFVNFSKIKAFPKPIQKPHPPLIAGGDLGPKSMDFIVRNCDGWIPYLDIPDWENIRDGIQKLHERATEIGRNPDSIALLVLALNLPNQKTIEAMEVAGIEEIVISLEAKTREEALPLLDNYAAMIK